MDEAGNTLGRSIQNHLREKFCTYNGDFSGTLQAYAVARQLDTGSTDLAGLAGDLKTTIVSENEEIRSANAQYMRGAVGKTRKRYQNIVATSDAAVNTYNALGESEFEQVLNAACDAALYQQKFRAGNKEELVSTEVQR